MCVGESVRSSLGPSTRYVCVVWCGVGVPLWSIHYCSYSIKAYIDESSGDDGLLLDTLHMVEALTSAEGGHSTNQILYESCQGQQKECGCGVTTLVCLSGLWAGGVVKLTQEASTSNKRGSLNNLVPPHTHTAGGPFACGAGTV